MSKFSPGKRKTPTFGKPVDQVLDLNAYKTAQDLHEIVLAVKGSIPFAETYKNVAILNARVGDGGSIYSEEAFSQG